MKKIVRLKIPSNIIAPNRYSWASSIHTGGSELVDALQDECEFFIRDVGSEFARYEGTDYGCINLKEYQVQVFDT